MAVDNAVWHRSVYGLYLPVMVNMIQLFCNTDIKNTSRYLPSTTKLLSILEAYISRVGGRRFWTGIIHLFPNTNLSFLNPPAHVAEARLCSQVHCCMMETVTQDNAGGNVCHLLSHWGMGPFTYSNQLCSVLARSCIYLGAMLFSRFLLWTEGGTTN